MSQAEQHDVVISPALQKLMRWTTLSNGLDQFLSVDPTYEVAIWPMACGARFVPMKVHPDCNSPHRRRRLPPGVFMPPTYLSKAQADPEEAKRICERHYAASLR